MPGQSKDVQANTHAKFNSLKKIKTRLMLVTDFQAEMGFEKIVLCIHNKVSQYEHRQVLLIGKGKLLKL